MESIPYEVESYRTNELVAPAEPVDVKVQLEPCPICTRTFAPKTLAKHMVICEKAAVKKRKKFDSSRQRREGTDLADFLPKNFGLPPSKQEPKTPPKAAQQQPSTPILPKKPIEPVKIAVQQQKKLPVLSSAASKDKSKAVVSRLFPPAEQCPHCERCFGVKAYDRHVEWCKEKNRIANSQRNPSVTVAKERLQARTKYKAPSVKTKRGANREKYSGSGLSCGDSTNSLSDGGSGGSASKSQGNSERRKANKMSTSMNSSIMSTSLMSDGGLYDKYDPFLSAKRQLEELCLPIDVTLSSMAASPTTPKARLTSSMSSSYTANPRSNPNIVKSNFHRTLSLRIPRKTTPSRSLFTPVTKQKPTIQRGLSDEGPISSKFLKPEEYDEMPVKSVCVNDYAVNRHTDTYSTANVVKRESAPNRNRRNLKWNLRNTDGKGINNPLSKTDSLAVFLQYEDATRITDIPIRLTEKDLKDKSNNLSKQTSLKSSANDLDCILSDKDKLSSLKNSLTNLLDSSNAMTDNPKIVDPYSNLSSISKVHSVKLEPLPKLLPIKSHASQLPPFALSFSSKENDFIDPKLINVCDNLTINVTKLSDSDLTSSSTDSMEKPKLQSDPQDLDSPKITALQQTASNRNSTEKRNLLKRQLRVGKNQFLYDISPETDQYSVECDKTISIVDFDSNKLDSSTSTIEPVLDEFDIEEFISSFEDAEEYPLFKDYKEFLSNRSLNKISTNSQNSIRSPTITSPIFNDGDDNDEKNEIFSSNESFLKHESKFIPYNTSQASNPESCSQNIDTNENSIPNSGEYQSSRRSVDVEEDLPVSDFNQNNLRNSGSLVEREENRSSTTNFEPSCDSATMMYPDNLDKLNSVESLTIRKSTSSKQSADSAYGSLSRHSPVDRGIRRTPNIVSRHQSSAPSEIYQTKAKILHKLDHKKRSRDLSVSSSSSEASLPNLHYPLAKEKSHPDVDAPQKKDPRMSKFCHECGSKFLISQAKFCMDCGVKRIVLD